MQPSAVPALSIRQPWAELIVSGRKSIEIRTWATHHRGAFYIHAAKHVDAELERSFGLHDVFHGGFVGGAELELVAPVHPRNWEAWRREHLVAGPPPPHAYAWVISKPWCLRTPIPARGQMGLFVPASAMAERLATAEHISPR